jgi:hypothetical protein
VAVVDMPHYNSQPHYYCKSAAAGDNTLTYVKLEQEIEDLEISASRKTSPLFSSYDRLPLDSSLCSTCSLTPRGSRSPLKVHQQALTFINVRTSNGKRDWEAESQIRSHAMRMVQDKRRRYKITLSERTEHLLLEPQASEHLPNPVNTENMQPQRETALWARIICQKCGGVQVIYDAQTRSVEIQEDKGLINSFGQASFDPFSQSATPISHRMHELMHYCRSNCKHRFWAQKITLPIGAFTYNPQINPMIYGIGNFSGVGTVSAQPLNNLNKANPSFYMDGVLLECNRGNV